MMAFANRVQSSSSYSVRATPTRVFALSFITICQNKEKSIPSRFFNINRFKNVHIY